MRHGVDMDLFESLSKSHVIISSPVPICFEWIVPSLSFREWISLLEANEFIQVEQRVEEDTPNFQSFWPQKVLWNPRMYRQDGLACLQKLDGDLL